MASNAAYATLTLRCKSETCHEVNIFCYQSKDKINPIVLAGYNYTCFVLCRVKLNYFTYLFSSSHSYRVTWKIELNTGSAQVTTSHFILIVTGVYHRLHEGHYMYLCSASLLFSSPTAGTPSTSLNCEDI